MKTSIILIAYLIITIGGGAGIFYYQSIIPNNELIKNDVTKRLLTIDGLDSDISELALRSRYNLDSNYDNLTRATSLLDQSLANLENTYFKETNRDESLLDRSYLQLKKEIEIKNDLIENFKSHNSVLRNSEKYAPAAGQNLMFIASEAKINNANQLLSNTVKELLEFSLLGSSVSVEKIRTSLPQLNDLKEKLPDFAQTAMVEFTNHINTVIVEKELTDQYLGKALIATTDTQIVALSENWNEWFAANSEQQDLLKQLLIAYISFLLIGLVLITFRLRSMYRHMDHEVAVRSEEFRQAFDDLKESESKLVQSEKMASLGQMVAGVAHEINTPLGYITSNVDTVRLNMGELDGILQGVDQISNELNKPKPNTKSIGPIIKKMVQVYRNMRHRETLSEIEELLKDSSYGLSEISNLVASLKDFSRLDRSNVVTRNIHESLDSTLKICHNLIGNRDLIKNYNSQLTNIECMPAQLNQVFLNIITNSVQATNEEGGIKITTNQTRSGVEIIFEDNGKGMSQDTQNQIFDPFFTTKEVGEGTGLGMSISYKIIKSHGGDIVVESQLDKGTIIKISLPELQSKAELTVIK